MRRTPITGKGRLPRRLTVLVTRPRRSAGELARRLREGGARVIVAPAIRTMPPNSWKRLDRAIADLKLYDTVIFTSANGVKSFFDRARRVLGRRPSQPGRLYAIGPRTAEALNRAGWEGVEVPETYEGGSLARFLGPVRGRRILIPRAKKARNVLPKTLKKGGARVEVVEAYRTMKDPSGLARIRQAVRRGQADVVTFTSPSTVEGFMASMPLKKIAEFFRRARAASIGPVTSSALRRRGIRRIIEARVYTAEGLARAILGARKG